LHYEPENRIGFSSSWRKITKTAMTIQPYILTWQGVKSRVSALNAALIPSRNPTTHRRAGEILKEDSESEREDIIDCPGGENLLTEKR
jgi:hypothetical protein